jgi:hypothetical protein
MFVFVCLLALSPFVFVSGLFGLFFVCFGFPRSCPLVTPNPTAHTSNGLKHLTIHSKMPSHHLSHQRMSCQLCCERACAYPGISGLRAPHGPPNRLKAMEAFRSCRGFKREVGPLRQESVHASPCAVAGWTAPTRACPCKSACRGSQLSERDSHSRGRTYHAFTAGSCRGGPGTRTTMTWSALSWRPFHAFETALSRPPGGRTQQPV